LLRACAEQGVRVPEELAVTGFDGFRDEKLPARELVTVACPWEKVAETALEVLMGLIEGRNDSHKSEEIRLPVTLLSGDTA
jgi:LacI family transcriptional regulator